MNYIVIAVSLVLIWWGLPDSIQLKIKYRSRYWLHKVVAFFGWCAECKEPLNTATSGAKFCPCCKKRKY